MLRISDFEGKITENVGFGKAKEFPDCEIGLGKYGFGVTIS
jgi:hypothetical protein